jgi:polar amino acid transport system substrate-binding protein
MPLSSRPAAAALTALVVASLFLPAGAQSPGELRWCGDPEGGAPYVESDPADATKVVGFEVDIAAVIAKGLGLQPRFVYAPFVSIDASVKRGDCDIGLSGIEDTPARLAAMAATVPYYRFREVLTVRGADRTRFRSLADLAGRRVGTLGGTIAYEMLLEAETDHRIEAVSYDDDVHPYSDLAIGRLDGVLLDNVLAEKEVRLNPALVNQPDALAVAHYVGVLSPDHRDLRDRINVILRTAIADGTLERIFRRWNIWNADQPPFHASLLSGVDPKGGDAAPRAAAKPRATDELLRYLPSIVNAALITVVLSCLAMALAVALGMVVASGRIYAGWPLRVALTGYVELMRGTPLLLQLFVLYYGLASAIRLPAFVAALIGLGMNYAAYESEIYRGALQAVPRGQLEAARTLGFSEYQIFRLVRGPQALRLALAPMTNDFVALLKDSSLVSVLTVVELTKQTAIFAANIGSWVIPGALCAAMYLAMSLPLARLARRLERRWSAPTS